MPIQVQGNSGTAAEVETNTRAMRITYRGVDYGSLGTYRLSVATGTMAAGLAAASEIFQWRWADATRLCLVERISFDGMGSITAFAAGVAVFQSVVARAWTVDGSGGTAIAFTTNNQKQRTSMGTSLMSTAGAARIATTAVLTTAGTKTLDGQAFGQAVGGLTATAGAGLPEQAMMDVLGVGMGLVLANQEGFVIRATVPATGTWTAGFTIHWSELVAY